LELSYLLNYGYGTSVYTGAQRYSLKNFSITQHRLQLRGDNFYVRAYTTRENSGDSYIAEFLGKRVNDIRSGGNVSNYLGAYAIYYLEHLYNLGYDFANDDPASVPVDQRMAAHNFADQTAQAAFPLDPESSNFESIKKQALKGVVPDGPSFKDATNMYHAETQYDFKNEVDFMELAVGGSFRMYELNSNGTIFDDGANPITIQEYGAYVQGGKWLGNRKVKLTGSARYDKNQNFNGRINPRIAAVFKVSDNHNLRVSYQTGFRIPTTQGQHIDLNIISARLLGGLPKYAEKYDLVRTSTTNVPLSFTGESVQAFRNEVFATGNFTTAAALLRPYENFEKVKPENVQNIEFGYKGVLNNNFLVDFTYYYNIYTDFITQIRVVTASETTGGVPNYASLLNGTAHAISSTGAITGNTSQIYSNYDGQITSQGAVLGLSYNFIKGYSLSGNYNWNVINDEPSEFFTEFNTPEHKVNLSFGNRKLTEKLGFSVSWRWQTEFEWQSSFTLPANGMVPSYNTFDGQISYKVPAMKSTIKIGGSNLLNKKYIQSLGGVNIGAIYYISVTLDDLLR
jgi:outer membrane receptor protein involved in Fe transport